MKPGDNNLVRAEFSDAHAQQANDLVRQLEEALPFLARLSRDERQSLVKVSDDHLELIERFGHVISARQSLFPIEHCSGAEIARDVEVARNLTALLKRLEALTEHIKSTIAASRSDAARQVSVGYGLASQLAPHVPGLASELEPMRDHYSRSPRRPSPSSAPTADDSADPSS